MPELFSCCCASASNAGNFFQHYILFSNESDTTSADEVHHFTFWTTNEFELILIGE